MLSSVMDCVITKSVNLELVLDIGTSFFNAKIRPPLWGLYSITPDFWGHNKWKLSDVTSRKKICI